MRVVVSEAALTALLAYRDQSPAHSERVTRILKELEEDTHDRHVLRLTGSQRPIWVHPLDENTNIYFTHGHGADAPELRIALVEPPPSAETDLKRLLYTTGDVPYHEIADSIRVVEQQETSARPELPDRVLDADTSLQSYLTPSDETLIAELADV